ncbi:MAG: hypothetical protein AAGC60_24970 [Acidobacteriota bacterium]
MHQIDSAETSSIIDSSSASLLQELAEKRKKATWFPWVIMASLLALIGTAGFGPGWALPLAAVSCLGCCYWAAQQDLLRRTTVIIYELEEDIAHGFQRLHEWAGHIAKCHRIWQIEAEGRVRDSKYHGGAGSLVERRVTSIGTAAPPLLKTNVATIALGVGRQTLYFLPDRILVIEGTAIGAVDYRNLELTVQKTRFIEETSPADATIVGWTWRYVNKHGGPDRRFADNPQLPICLYEELTLRSSTGLHEVIQMSREQGGAEGLVAAIDHLADLLPVEQP